ncbi:DUF6545 domain-containing protein [Nocardia harenae]|uniref:DUF6545 domain-containing protein n=1 Tax=Nocardia harenae TaxID=358707 RepID=UPI00082F45D0|nr:DUF6545 domain-containing protein [Nocardia harenae]
MWPHHHLPTAITVAATAFIVAVTAIRLTLIGRTSAFGRLINTLLALDATAALLREPIIARRLADRIPGGLATVFDAWHWLTVVAWACGMGMVLLRAYGPVRYRIRFAAVLGSTALLGLFFLILSAPARAGAAVSIAEYGGWRYGVYIALYLALPVIVSCQFYLLKKRGLAWRATTPWEKFTVNALIGLGIASLLPVCSLMITAALDAAGMDTAPTRAVYDLAVGGVTSGEPGLFVFAAVVVIFVPSSTRAVLQFLRLDSESRCARRLHAVWDDLTTAAPGVVLRLRRVDSWRAAPRERLHRRRMEIHDAAEIVARYVRPLPTGIDDYIEATVAERDQESVRLVAELVLAAARLTECGGQPGDATARRTDVPDERTLLRLWAPATTIVRAAGHPAAELPRPAPISTA